MDSLQWFILAILGLIFIAGCHRRILRYRLAQQLLDEDKSPSVIERILKAYDGEEDQMAKRQLITIDITFKDNWSELDTKEILKIIVDKGVKNVQITNVNKRKEK